MTLRVPLVLLGLAGFALAGCVDSAPASQPNGGAAIPDQARPAEVGEDTGGIEGIVVDSELQPLEAVIVGLKDLDLETLTAKDGRFSLSNVPPGTHAIYAGKLGYDSVGSKVEVQIGIVSTVQLTLDPLAVAEAYSRVFNARGMLGCAVDIESVIGFAACGLPVVNDTVQDRFLIVWTLREPTEPWNTTVFETHWKSNQVLSQGLNPIWEVNGCANDNDVTFAEGGGRSPVIFRVDEDRIEWVLKNVEDGRGCGNAKNECNAKGCRLYSRMFSEAETTGQAVDVGVTFQQSYESWMSSFFYEAPLGEYTAKPDT